MKVHAKVIVVTGAGSGIGRELVLHLLSKGAAVAGVDLNQTSLGETAKLALRYSRRSADSSSMSLTEPPLKDCPIRCSPISERSTASSIMPA